MKTIPQVPSGEPGVSPCSAFEEGLVPTVLDALSEHIAILDAEGTIIAVNEAWCRFADQNNCLPGKMGLGENYLGICRKAAQATQAKGIQDIADGIQAVLSGVRPDFAAEYACNSPTEQRWFAMSVRPLVRTEKGAVVTHENITELKLRENALRESEALFRSLFENHSAIKLIIDPTTARIIDANAAAVGFYGWSLEELRRMSMHQINTLPPEAMDSESAKARNSPRETFQFRHRRANGSVRDVEVYCNRIRTGDRDLLYSIIHDITDRKLAEDARKQLEDRNRHLEKSLSLNRMAGAVAHHFNNQLQAMMMSQELALNSLPDPERAREYLQMAQNSAREANSVSSLMLTYLGQNVLRHQPLDLGATCLAELRQICAEKPRHVTLEQQIPSPGPAVRSNSHEIHQILGCLVTNAWEACMPGRATVRITVRACHAAEIPAANRFPVTFSPAAPGYVCIEVSDTGSGIPGENIGQLFDPFYSTKFAGRGLGLPVVLGIVRSHEGVVTVESEPGHGSTFRIFLPQAARQG